MLITFSLPFRIRVGFVSHKWLVLSRCLGCCQFAAPSRNTISTRCSHHTRCHRCDAHPIARSLRCCSTCWCSRLKRCCQLGCVEAPWTRNHIHETSLLEPHSVRQVRVLGRWRFGEMKFKIYHKLSTQMLNVFRFFKTVTSFSSVKNFQPHPMLDGLIVSIPEFLFSHPAQTLTESWFSLQRIQEVSMVRNPGDLKKMFAYSCICF